MSPEQVLQQFQATGVQTCFHDRHIEPQIYKDLDGTNWRLKDYEARDGYKALRKILSEALVPKRLRVTEAREPSERAIASSRRSIAWAAATAERLGSVPKRSMNAATSRFPLGGRSSESGPGWVSVIPSAAAPASNAVAVPKASAAMSCTSGPRRARSTDRSRTVVG